jgi:hypothetical protein
VNIEDAASYCLHFGSVPYGCIGVLGFKPRATPGAVIGRIAVSSSVTMTIHSHHPLMVGAAMLSLLFFTLGGCQSSSCQPVTVTVVDPEWAQPDVSPTPRTNRSSSRAKPECSLRS